jgi:acyl carrier protein
MQSAAKREGKHHKKQEIEKWLIEQIAGILYLDPQQIDPQATFNSYGLSSRDAVMLSGDLEEWLGRRLSPTLVYEYPTIDNLAEYLARPEQTVPERPSGSSSSQPAVVEQNAAARQFAAELTALDVEKMSDAEAEARLLEKLNKLNGTK